MSKNSPQPIAKLSTGDGRPDFLVRLGVLLPCSVDDVKAAYRAKVMTAHPDVGGSPEDFRRLEEDFQASLQYAQLHAGRRVWLAANIERYAAQEQLVAEIRRRGGSVELKSIDWLRQEVGDDFAQVLDTIVAIHLTGPAITIADVQFLCRHAADLGSLKRLDLSGARIGNRSVALLRQLKGLTELNLSGTFVSNSAARPLARMPALQTVFVGGTFMGLVGRWHLQLSRLDLKLARQPTTRTAQHRIYAWTLAAVALYWIACFAATHVSVPDVRVPEWRFVPFDKVVHASMYMGLAILLSCLGTLRTASGESSLQRTFVHSALIILALAAYGLFDENTQPFFHRTYDLLDWAADLTGAVSGIVLFHAVRQVIARLRARPEPATVVA